MRKKTRKISKKRLIIKIIILVILIIFILGIVFVFGNLKGNKSISADYINTSKKINIYDSNNHKIGYIDKDITLDVDTSKSTFSDYYKIKDLDVYVKKDDVNIEEKGNSNLIYLELGKEITTNSKYSLTSGDKNISVSKTSKFNIIGMDEDNYYINLSNNMFSILKSDVKNIKDIKISDNTTDASNISVINYNDISNICGDKYECISKDNLKEELDYIKSSKYYTISLNDYTKWLSGSIRLKDKAILLTTSNNNDLVTEINKEYNNMINVFDYTNNYNITFINDNNVSTKSSSINSLNNYNVRSNTSLDKFKDMVSGKHVDEEFNTSKYATSVPVLNYHFFYDLSKGQTNCKESICENVDTFRKQLDYLRDNEFTTLTMSEYSDWYFGKIEVPEKSVLITVDDGAYGTGFHNYNNLIPILEEYKMHATLFLIAGWWDINNYKSPYLEIQSHTYNMHNVGSCGDKQLICASYDEIVDDLTKSLNIIGDKTSFCYPFYTYDDEAIKAIKDVGFKLAFAGGSRKSTRKSNQYTIPRYPIYDSTTLEQFKKMVN